MEVECEADGHEGAGGRVAERCEFAGGAAGGGGGGGAYAAGAWPTGWCHAPSATCTTLGVKDNMCGECK
eukprot:3753785-Rhodomonas_salina.1